MVKNSNNSLYSSLGKKNIKYFKEKNSYLTYCYFYTFVNYFSSLLNLNYLNYEIRIKLNDCVNTDQLYEEELNSLVYILNEIEMIESSYLVLDKGKSIVYIIFSVRPLFVNNRQLLNNIFSYFISYPYCKNIIYFKRLINKKDFKMTFLNLFKYNMKYHFLNLYSDDKLWDLNNLKRVYASLLDSFDFMNMIEGKYDIKQKKNPYSSIPGYYEIKLDEYYLIYLWQIYFILKKMILKLENNKLIVYCKYNKGKYSYFQFNFIDLFVMEHKTVIKDLQSVFFCQLENINLYYKTSIFLTKAYNLLLRESYIYFPVIEINKKVIEFRDGLFLVDQGIFILENGKEESLNNYETNSFLYIDLNFVNSKLISNDFILEIAEKIKSFYKNKVFYNINKEINNFLLNIGNLINTKFFFNIDLDIINLIKNYIDTFLNINLKDKVELLNFISPFFLLQKYLFNTIIIWNYLMKILISIIIYV